MVRILLVHCLSWPNIARLARAFHDVGAEVCVLADPGHPVHRIAPVARGFPYRPNAPVSSLRRAIEGADPDLIVPCDEVALDTLRTLHARAEAAMAGRIERSLGRPVTLGEGVYRAALADYASEPGIVTPPVARLTGLRQLRDFVGRAGLPVVLKLDGSWGGRDIVVVDGSRPLGLDYAEIRVRNSALWYFKRMVSEGEVEPIFARRWRDRRLSVQAFVKGSPANIAFAAWRGEVVAAGAVEAVVTKSRFGFATVVRKLDHQGMIAAARAIARRLELSGIHGLDFILDAEGRAQLIEINLRATQIAHLVLTPGQDLPAALLTAYGGKAAAPRPAAPASEIALFPGEWVRDRNSPWFAKAHHDLPVEDPEMLAAHGFALPAAGPASE